MAASLFNAALFEPTSSTLASLKGSLDLTNREPFPAWWAAIRLERLFVIPVYREPSRQASM